MPDLFLLGNVIKKEKNMSRDQISEEALETVFGEIRVHLKNTLAKKGSHSFASRHELESVVRMELKEVEEILMRHHDDTRLKEELLDVIVPSLFGIACINEKTMDW